jgi:hypothetical protein
MENLHVIVRQRKSSISRCSKAYGHSWPSFKGAFCTALDRVTAAGLQEQDFAYRLEMWDDRDAHIEELIALVIDRAVAPPFAEAVRSRGCFRTAEGDKAGNLRSTLGEGSARAIADAWNV